MSVISWPDDIQIRGVFTCVVCGAEKDITELTVGMCDAQGEQAFACNRHFLDSGQFIAGWADFAARQTYCNNYRPTPANEVQEP